MGLDDANDAKCGEHWWIPADFQTVERSGVDAIGFGILNECGHGCGAMWYEPSNLDLFPDTAGLDPRLQQP